MGESRAADYIAYGMNRGVDRFLEGIEKRKEEEKNRAREFKSLVEFADASGMLSKDQAMVMDRDSLKGFVQGKMYNSELQQRNQADVLRQFEFLRKMQSDQAMGQFAQDYANNTAMGYSPQLSNFYENPEQFNYQQPAADPLAAFQAAMAANPMAATDERFGAMSTAMHQLQPKEYVPTEFTKDLEAMHRAEAMGNTADAEIYKAKIQKAVSSSGLRIEFDDNGRPIITQGDLNAPTTATKTKAQENEANAAATFATIDHIMANQQEGDWGVRGLIGKVKDEWLAQFVPGMADPRRIDVQASISQLRQQAMAALKAESQISQKDKEELLASAPKIGASESQISGLQKIYRFRQLIAEKVRAYSAQLGKPPPIYAMTLQQIADAHAEGKLTDDQAVDAVNKYYPDRLK